MSVEPDTVRAVTLPQVNVNDEEVTLIGWHVKDGGQAVLDAAGFAIHHRCIEQSNVQPIDELVRMISSLRDYEACARSLKSLGDSAERLYVWAGS